jgi:hypothetical protein
MYISKDEKRFVSNLRKNKSKFDIDSPVQLKSLPKPLRDYPGSKRSKSKKTGRGIGLSIL